MTNLSKYCVHYKGMKGGNLGECEAGVAFAPLLKQQGFGNLPCHTPEQGHVCAHHQLPTKEEADAEMKMIADSVTAFAKFMAHEIDTCFHCGKRVTSLEQVDRCVYGSCGCRMYQGTIPDAWK